MAQPQGNARPVDPNVNVPPAVMRAAAEAERLQTEQKAARDAAAGNPPAEEPKPTNAEPEKPPAPTHPEPEKRPQPTHPEPDPNAKPEPDPAQLLATERGRVAALTKQVQSLTGKTNDLEGLIAAMQIAAPAPAAAPAQFERLVTPEEVETWSPELIDVVSRKVQEIVAPLKAELQSKIDNIDGRVRETGRNLQVSAREKMLQTLDTDETIPNWRIVNQDDAFLDWLMVVDTFSGQTRSDMVKHAFERNDAARVSAFFRTYLQETGASPAPNPSPAGGQSPAPKPGAQAKPTLESLAAPGKGNGASPSQGGSAAKPNITTTQISMFYRDKAAGKYRGREQEAADNEKEIADAMRDGRITQG